MSAIVFNNAHGRIAELFLTRGDNGIVLLLTTAEQDEDLQDYGTIEDLLASPGNTEMSGGGYVRKAGLSGAVVVDDALNETSVEISDQTWGNLSGAPVQKAILAFEFGVSDADRVPLMSTTWPFVPDGNDATLRFP